MSLFKFHDLIDKEKEILEKLRSINELDLSIFTPEIPEIKKLRSSYVARRFFNTNSKSFFLKEYLEYTKIKNEIIEENLLLVKFLVNKNHYMKKMSTSRKDDLYQEGYILLNDSVDMFDPSFGYKFSTYAGSCIKMGLRKVLNDSDSIKLPRRVVYGNRKIESMKNSYYLLNGEFPSENYVKKYAKKNNIDYHPEVQNIYINKNSSNDGGDDTYNMEDIISFKSYDGNSLSVEDKIDIKKIIENFDVLNEIEKPRMESYLECGSLSEIGRELNLTRGCIHLNFIRSVSKLKARMKV